MLKEISIYVTNNDLKKWSCWLWPNSWWYIRILIPYQGLFFDEACEHDILYSWWWTKEDKIFADIQFYLWCLNKSENILQFYISSLYYYWVKYQWHRFFNYH